MRDAIVRWSRRHPSANAALVVVLGLAVCAFGVVRFVQHWSGPLSAALFAAGLAVGAGTAVLSYRAAYVDRWEVGDELRTALRFLQGVSAVAALACFREWGPDWLTECAAGFVVALGLWLAPAAIIGRRLRLADPEAADELYRRSRDVMGGM